MGSVRPVFRLFISELSVYRPFNLTGFLKELLDIQVMELVEGDMRAGGLQWFLLYSQIS
jgi:hypothetical protein